MSDGPRFILVHAASPVIDHTDDHVHAHCFGPFDTMVELQAFDAAVPDDCYSFTLPLVGPDEDDIVRGARYELDRMLLDG